MSASTVQAVLASDLHPLGLRMVAVVMAWHANEDTGHTWASLGTISDEAGLTRDRVKQVVRLMKEQSVIEVVTGRTGGSRRSTTTYVFCAAWLGKQHSRERSLPGNEATRERSLPGKGKAPDPGTSAHSLGNEASPNIDEKKTTSSLSSKSTRGAQTGDTAAGRAPPLAAPRLIVVKTAPAANPNSQQPPSEEGPRYRSAYPWMDDPAQCDAKALSLGLSTWADAEAAGTRYGVWLVSVINAYRKKAAGAAIAPANRSVGKPARPARRGLA